MKTFSLRSILVAFVFAALLLSVVVSFVRLQEVNRELDTVRQNYGYMKIEDETKINVISLAQERSHNGDALRFVIPPGKRYFLHLSETTAEDNDELPSGRHKTTVSLGWKEGQDVILGYRLLIDPVKQTPYLRVGSRNQDFFTYRPDDWPSEISLSTVSQLQAHEKLELSPDEPIILMRATSKAIDRGIVLWLETESHRNSQSNP
jgi:hypothetical protein